MGMGHLRAAYPLRHFGLDGVLIYGSKNSTPKSEYEIWRKIRTSYYFFSRAGKIPLIGKFLVHCARMAGTYRPYLPAPGPLASQFCGPLSRSRDQAQRPVPGIDCAHKKQQSAGHSYLFCHGNRRRPVIGQRARKLPFDLRQRLQPGLGAENAASQRPAVSGSMHPGQTPPDVVRSTRGKYLSHRVPIAQREYRQRNRP